MGRQIYRDIPGSYSTDPPPKLPNGKAKQPAPKAQVKPKPQRAAGKPPPA